MEKNYDELCPLPEEFEYGSNMAMIVRVFDNSKNPKYRYSFSKDGYTIIDKHCPDLEPSVVIDRCVWSLDRSKEIYGKL